MAEIDYNALLSQASGLGAEDAALQLQLAQARKLRESAAAPMRSRGPLSGFAEAIGAGIDNYTGRRDEAAATTGLAGVGAKRSAMLAGLPATPESPQQSRALQRALAGDPGSAAVAGTYGDQAKAQETELKWTAGNQTKLTAEAMKNLTTEQVARLKAGTATFHPLTNDSQNSGVITHMNPDGSIHHLEFIGHAKPPSAGGAGGMADEDLTPMALEQMARAAIHDPSVLSRFPPRSKNRTRVMNKMAELEPNHPFAESWAAYKGDVAAATDNAKSEARLRPYKRMLGKNAQIVLDTMDKIPDSEISAVNWFMRGGKRLLGDPEVAAFDAALNAFSTEAARVLTNPNLTGQLTDSARADLAAVHSKNFSKAQLERVIHITELESANRLDELAAEGVLRRKAAGARTPSDKPKPALPGALGGAPVINDEASYNALPPGAEYIDGRDNVKKRKKG